MAWIYPAAKRLAKIYSRDDGVDHLGEEKGRRVRSVLGLMRVYAEKDHLSYWFKIPQRFWDMARGMKRLPWDYMGQGPHYAGIPFEEMLPYLDYCEIQVTQMVDTISLELTITTFFQKLNLHSKDIPIKDAPPEVFEIIGEEDEWVRLSKVVRNAIKQRNPYFPLYRRASKESGTHIN